MIYIFHGENLAFSRDRILKIQNLGDFESKTEILIEDTTPQQLSDIIFSPDFFGNPPFVILDISNVGRSNVDDFIKVLKIVPKECVVVILSSKELSKTNVFIKMVHELEAKVILSDRVSESNIFNFIDNVFFSKRDAGYKNLSELMNDGHDPIYILTMLEYTLRNIAYSKFNSPMLTKISPFSRAKANNQSRLFSEESIRNLYAFFYQVDLDSKIGEISADTIIPFCMEKVFSEINL